MQISKGVSKAVMREGNDGRQKASFHQLFCVSLCMVSSCRAVRKSFICYCQCSSVYTANANVSSQSDSPIGTLDVCHRLSECPHQPTRPKWMADKVGKLYNPPCRDLGSQLTQCQMPSWHLHAAGWMVYPRECAAFLEHPPALEYLKRKIRYDKIKIYKYETNDRISDVTFGTNFPPVCAGFTSSSASTMGTCQLDINVAKTKRKCTCTKRKSPHSAICFVLRTRFQFCTFLFLLISNSSFKRRC